MKNLTVLLISMGTAFSAVAQDDPLLTSNSTSEGKRDAAAFTIAGTPYTTEIKNGKDIFTASYDRDGVMEKSRLRVYDGELPVLVNETLAQLLGWRIEKSLQTTSYDGNNTITNLYRVKLYKGGKHKTIFLDSNGEITNYRLKEIDRATALARF